MKKSKNFLYIIVGLAAGSLLTLATGLALAHNGDINLIHACYKTNTGGSFRIVGPNEDCNPNIETALDWNIQGIQGPPGPTGVPGQNGSSNFTCIGCSPRDLLLRLNAQNLINANLDSSVLSFSDLSNQNLSGGSFIEAILNGVDGTGANFTDTNFTNANLRASFPDANFTRANLTGADFSLASLPGANFTDANVANIIWSRTVCPDGSWSPDNGDTCVGHLTP